MAKLRAHGGELLRIEREVEISDPELSTTWRRVTRAYMANGKILEKYDVRFKSTTGVHSYGWRLWGNIKKGLGVPAAVATIAGNIRAKGTEAQWKIVSGGAAPVTISEAQIMRALESGEYIGFCKECGHSQDGCEPDMRGGKCEHCGAMAVYGAEEMLISL